MTGIQLNAILNLSIGIEVMKMYYKNYDLEIDKANDIILDLYKGTCNFLDKMQDLQELFYRYRIIEKEDKQDISQLKVSIATLDQVNNKLSCEDFFTAVSSLRKASEEAQCSMQYASGRAWEQWNNLTNKMLLDAEVGVRISGSWSITGCAIDGVSLDYLTRVAQGNICCSLITGETIRLYNNRQIALLYECNANNTFVMCNGDLNTGLGSINRYDLYDKIFEKFYRDFYSTTYISTGAMPEICNPGSRVFYDVLPLELMKESIKENRDKNVQNEIVINGHTRPYGLLCHTDSLDYGRDVCRNFAALGWVLDLVELTRDHSLVKHGLVQ